MKELLEYVAALPEPERMALAANLPEVGALAKRLVDSRLWQVHFGHLENRDFNPERYPWVDEGDEAEEFAFYQYTSGAEALRSLARLGRKPASLAAQGRYLRRHPLAQQGHPLIGIGATRRSDVVICGGPIYLWCPMYGWGQDGPAVQLFALFSPSYNWSRRCFMEAPPGYGFLVQK